MSAFYILSIGEPVWQRWAQFGDLFIALVLSSAIGLEREQRQKSAGLRTNVLVGLGAALFMLFRAPLCRQYEALVSCGSRGTLHASLRRARISIIAWMLSPAIHPASVVGKCRSVKDIAELGRAPLHDNCDCHPTGSTAEQLRQCKQMCALDLGRV